LIFSQFTSHLALVAEALKARGVAFLSLDGSTPAAERKRLVDEFQHGDAPAFLISVKAGGFGLNLTAASNVIHLDPWWNPAVEDQASDRAHRIGQRRAVTIYRLISSGTVEEKMLTLHARKRELVDQVLSGHGKVATDELLKLFGA
jgi:SNF2 family DNA or RNA helicase